MLEAERESYGEVVLTGRLTRALQRLNPIETQDAVSEALRSLLTPAGGSLLLTNQAMHRLLVDGVEVELPDGLKRSESRTSAGHRL